MVQKWVGPKKNSVKVERGQIFQPKNEAEMKSIENLTEDLGFTWKRGAYWIGYTIRDVSVKSYPIPLLDITGQS